VSASEKTYEKNKRAVLKTTFNNQVGERWARQDRKNKWGGRQGGESEKKKKLSGNAPTGILKITPVTQKKTA